MQQYKTERARESVCVATEVGSESFSLHKVTNMILQKERGQECVPSGLKRRDICQNRIRLQDKVI